MKQRRWKQSLENQSDFGFANTTQNTITCPCWKCLMLPVVQLIACQDFEHLFHRAAFKPAAPSLHWFSECSGTGCRTFCAPWGACHSVFLCDEVSLNSCSMCQLINPFPPCLSLLYFCYVCFIPSWGLVIKLLVDTDPQGMCLLITCLLDFVLLIKPLNLTDPDSFPPMLIFALKEGCW